MITRTRGIYIHKKKNAIIYTILLDSTTYIILILSTALKKNKIKIHYKNKREGNLISGS